MIYEDDSHLIGDDEYFLVQMDKYIESAKQKLTDLEILAMFGDFKQFKYNFIEERANELCEQYGDER